MYGGHSDTCLAAAHRRPSPQRAPCAVPVPSVMMVARNWASVKSMPAVTATWPSRLNHLQREGGPEKQINKYVIRIGFY